MFVMKGTGIMKKIFLIVIILLILLIPIPNKLKDGGSIEWHSLTYSITKVHKMSSFQNYKVGYETGIVVKIFNKTIYDNTKYEYTEKYIIVDSSKDIKEFACDDALEEIYKDDSFIYYLPCIKSEYIKVIDVSSKEERNIKEALQNATINIKDLERFNIEYLKAAIDA